jgi:hypothetical protein
MTRYKIHVLLLVATHSTRCYRSRRRNDIAARQHFSLPLGKHVMQSHGFDINKVKFIR